MRLLLPGFGLQRVGGDGGWFRGLGSFRLNYHYLGFGGHLEFKLVKVRKLGYSKYW